MKWPIVALAASVLLLLVADFLAFHDWFEPHTVRDWIMLAASGLAVVGFAGQSRTLFAAIHRNG